MEQDFETPDAIANAWLNQIETAVRKVESLAGFYRLSVEERRPGAEVDAFFHNRTEMELMDSQSYLRLLQMKWEEIKPTIDFAGVGKRHAFRIREMELRMEGALKQYLIPGPKHDLDYGMI
ncbi:MAG: hypothetical protein UY62_C0012G0002 [Parcubacteria group bacterium GW2011_GWF2_50_9]|nr:MAG: hypothetical protein UY62_C0012G0002 [Parcubacteria group bacterium GW2011_GWF2_50_9]